MPIIEWDEKEIMSKEFALSSLDIIGRFCRRMYFHPESKPFNCKYDFECQMNVIRGLKDYILSKITE